MERLDYIINEDGIERWVSRDRVVALLAFYFPSQAVWEEIEQNMRRYGHPFKGTLAGKRVTIEYKGPQAKPSEPIVRRRLGIYSLIAVCLFMSSCKGGIESRLFGPDYHGESKKELFIVAACMDNNATGHPTTPTFLPDAHVDLIKRVKVACLTNHCQIDGNTWLAIGVDCGHEFHYIGDEYYAGRGY